MRTPFALAALATLCVVLVAADQSRVWRAPHMEAVPEWKRVPEPLPRGLELTLSFALKQQNLDLLEKTLLEVSDPRHERYGKYLTLSQLNQMVAPSRSAIQKVTNWAASKGLRCSVLESNDWMECKASVEKIERALSCELAAFVNTEEINNVLVRAVTDYSIDSEVAQHIDFVAGLHGLPKGKTEISVGAAERVSITPSSVVSMYKITEATGPVARSSQAVVEFGSNYFSPSDLQIFFQTYAPNLVGLTVEQIYGNNRPDLKTGVEANLDVQYIMSIGAFVNTSDYASRFSIHVLDSFLNYVTLVNSQNQPPLVHSISFGQYGGHYNNETVQRIDVEFQKMGTRGITVLVASGDNGVGCNSKCTSQEFDFPSSPWVTLVGATYLDPTTNTEIGTNFSSGGFSRDQWMPSYQASAVGAYFQSGVALPPSSFYNPNGRAYPDVASIGQNIEIIVEGKEMQVAGTSCAAPIWAGIISLLNNYRLTNGKNPLGFVNPLFYQNPSVFTDITEGTNPYGCCPGFECAPGWDPVTGLGTPIYSSLLALVSNLP